VFAEADIPGLLELTGGAQVSLDALGSPDTAAASVRVLRRRGRHVQVGLMLGDAATAALPWGELISKELEVVGSHGMAAADYPQLLAMVADGRLDIARLLGRVVGLDDAPAELAAMDQVVAPTAGIVVAKLRAGQAQGTGHQHLDALPC
jgi:alcohol dehydrogenase